MMIAQELVKCVLLEIKLNLFVKQLTHQSAYYIVHKYI